MPTNGRNVLNLTAWRRALCGPGHYGLAGMGEHAKQMGAQLSIWSGAGAGTEIELSVPASNAYTICPKFYPWRLFRGLRGDWCSLSRRPFLASRGRRSNTFEHIIRTSRSWICRCRRWAVSTRSVRFAVSFPTRELSPDNPCWDFQFSRALKAGARGYLLKGMLRQELLQTIRAVHAGQKRLSAEAAAGIAEHATDYVLTPREIDILRLIANEMQIRRSLENCRSPRKR
jgi:hypothetical protein